MNCSRVVRWILSAFVIISLTGATIAGVFMLAVEHHRSASFVFQSFLQPLGAGVLSLMFIYRELLAKSDRPTTFAAATTSQSAAQAAANPHFHLNLPATPAPVIKINIDDKLIRDQIDTLLHEAPVPATGKIVAKSFVLTDAQGVRRAVLSTTAEGAPFLSFLSQEEKPDFLIVDDNGQSFVSFFTEGRRRFFLGLHPGGSDLAFFDNAGEMRAVLGLGSDESPSLLLVDAKGSPRCALAVEASNESVLGLLGKNGKIWLLTGSAALGDVKPGPRIFFVDQHEQVTRVQPRTS